MVAAWGKGGHVCGHSMVSGSQTKDVGGPICRAVPSTSSAMAPGIAGRLVGTLQPSPARNE
jgi:hypothetical protein